MNYYTKPILAILIASSVLQPAQIYSMGRIFNKRNFAIVGAATALGTATYKFANKMYFSSIHWDWKNINPTHIKIHAWDPGLDHSNWTRKEPFATISISDFFKRRIQYLNKLQEPDRIPSQNEWLWGAGTSAHQVEANCTNNEWSLFEAYQDDTDEWVAPTLPDGRKALLDGQIILPAGIGCDSWKHEDEDIKWMKELGLNTYRFSVEWSKVVPRPGIVDMAVLNHYKQFCKKLVANGIKPVITFYHYTVPLWFYEMGSFEKEENIKHFVFFCQTVFRELQEHVYLWLTFNAPESVALSGWSQAIKPPAKKDYQLAVEVLHNILQAHVQVYQALKKMDGGPQSRIGILKNIYQLDPWDYCNPLHHLKCLIGNKLQNDSVYDFLTTGEFKVYVPTKAYKKATNEHLKHGGKCLDFIGLNYYCHGYLGGSSSPFREPNGEIEIPVANKRYTIYGEGLYRAIEELSDRVAQPLNIPIYVTENGIGTDNHEHRTLFLQRYLYALARAIQDGHDVRGYIHWSLMDNYEWGKYQSHYGLLHVDRSTSELKRSKKVGALYYENVAKGLTPTA